MCKKHTRFLQLLVALKKTRPICIATLALSVCMLLCACTNNVDSMIEDYNGHFVPETKSYGIDDIVSNELLNDSYYVSWLTTLNIVAPEGAGSYEWTAEVYENADGDKRGTSFVLSVDRKLSLFIKDSPIKRWGTYKLTLTVTKSNGEILKDTAWLYVV